MFIDKQPQTWTPAYNPVLFVVSSTYSNVLFFKFNLNDYNTNERIINDKAYVSPITPTSSHYNISDIARDLVRWQIINDGTIANGLKDSVKRIQLKGSDQGVIGVTMSQLGQTASSDAFYVWNGFFPRHQFTDFNHNSWVLKTSTTSASPIKFLTKKPNYSLVNNYSREFLYYLKEENLGSHLVTFRSFNAAGTLLQTYSKEVVSTFTQSMMRLDVSPKAVRKQYDIDFPDVPPTFLTGASSYCVHLSRNGATVSEVKCFKYVPEPDCGLDIVNILWQNELGGIDSYQFIQPVETKNVERFQILRNPYQYDAGYNYTDMNNNIYNDRERIIHNNPSTNWQMWTRVLSQEENNWIGGILQSRGWYIELKNGRVYPVMLAESSYQVRVQDYIRGERLQSQFTFNIVDQYIADGQIYAGTVSIPTTTTTTTTTTTSSTTTTTTEPSTTTTTTSTTTTTTTATLNEFTGCGRGNSTNDACSDRVNNRTFYSNCTTINTGCTIYLDSAGLNKLLTYTHIYIDGISWRIGPSSGIIQYVDVDQCP